MRLISAILMTVALAMNVSSQSVVYRPGTFDAEKAVEQALDKLKLPKGSSEILTYKEAWSETFKQYEKNRSVKAGFDDTDLENQLKSEVDEQSKFEGLQRQRALQQARIDSLNNVLGQLKEQTAQLTGSTIEVGETDATLKAKIGRDTLTVADNTRKIEALDAEIARLESEVAARETLNENKRSSNDSAAESLEASKSSWSTVIEEVTESLQNGREELSRPIEECNVAVVENAIATYEERRSSIATIDAARAKKLDGDVKAMKERLEVIRPISDAIALMGERYNKKNNEKMIATLEKSKTTNKRLMTSADIASYDNIIEALKREDNAYRNLTYLMGELGKMAPTNQSAVKAKVAEVVSYINPGATRYNAYYTRLNNALQLIENAESLTQKDIDNIKSAI